MHIKDFQIFGISRFAIIDIKNIVYIYTCHDQLTSSEMQYSAVFLNLKKKSEVIRVDDRDEKLLLQKNYDCKRSAELRPPAL